jgi:hypothetical protein
MDRIQVQFTKLTQLLFDPKTIESYQTVLVLTWNILKEAALLLWLVICSVFVLAAWIGDNAIHTGRNVRAWVSQQSHSEADSSEKAAAVGQALLDVSQTGANYLLNQARVQLGLEKLEPPTKAEKPVVAPATTRPTAAAPKAKVESAPAPVPSTQETTTDTEKAAVE